MEKTTQEAKYLSGKHRGLSLDLQLHIKNQAWWYGLTIPVLGNEDRRVLVAEL